MYGNIKIGLFRVSNVKQFQGTVVFDIKPKIFLTYDGAYEYVRDSFTRNHKCMPWPERYIFSYDRADDEPITLHNFVKIDMIIPFYLHIGREWL